MGVSIRTRWVAVTLSVVLTAVVVTAVLSARQAADNTEGAVEDAIESRDVVFEQLVAYRDVVGGWDGVERLVAGLAEMTSTRLALTDDAGRVLADSAPGATLPAIPVGFVDEGFGLVAYEAPFDSDEVFELLEPLLACLDANDVGYYEDFGLVEIDDEPAGRDCVALNVDSVISAGGPFVVTVTQDGGSSEEVAGELIACFEDARLPFALVPDEHGVLWPEPLEDAHILVEEVVVGCLDSLEALELSGDLIGFGDGAVVYMDVNGADPFAVAADPFEPAVVLTVAAVMGVAALAA
ncbi:MAG: hypothetical protein P8N02_16220, partial [Actinomycetota bacterium]|nr:hypothetical protein [Actinomycetota bacterium]